MNTLNRHDLTKILGQKVLFNDTETLHLEKLIISFFTQNVNYHDMCNI